MKPAPDSSAEPFSGAVNSAPLSSPARRLRVMREALRQKRLFRPWWWADAVERTTCGKPYPPDGARDPRAPISDCPDSSPVVRRIVP